MKVKKNIRKLLNYLNSLIVRHEKTKKPRLYMTILAKNEVDVIEEHLKFHKAMGVDGFIVTDHCSTDGTLEVFERYKKLGWVKELIVENSTEFQQVKWVDRMIRLAKDKYNADWVINADADEFWYVENKDLKSTLALSHCNSIKVNIYNVMPTLSGKFFDSTRVIKGDISKVRHSFELHKFNVYTRQLAKVAHRTRGYQIIEDGNHGVKMHRKSERTSKEICIYHYSLRGIDHFYRKMVSGGSVLEKTNGLDRNSGNHWQYFYKVLIKDRGDINYEYSKVVGSRELQSYFSEKGIIVLDDRVKKILEKISDD
ncbi:glycosyltransferase family 2 protein [Vibrio furnissii]|uniref:glycosyltransferase family 2 protein n=1 Tax=Vibrio furnissii TaxID=29494 RepID=UPI003AA93543